MPAGDRISPLVAELLVRRRAVKQKRGECVVAQHTVVTLPTELFVLSLLTATGEKRHGFVRLGGRLDNGVTLASGSQCLLP